MFGMDELQRCCRAFGDLFYPLKSIPADRKVSVWCGKKWVKEG